MFADVITKAALYSHLIKDAEMLVQPGFEPANSHSRSAHQRSPNWANQAVVKWNYLAGVHSICFFPCIDPTCYKQMLLKYPTL